MVSVFIVDDDPALHHLYRELFELNGFRVIAEAYDGDEAIRIFKELVKKPDIILMDYRMPNMDGIESMKEILKLDPSIKVLFASADEAAKEEALKNGASGFMIKPFWIARFLETVKKTANR